MDFYGDPEIKKAYQAGFNDGLTCAVDNAQQFKYIDEEQAEELLTELVKEEN
jgi:DNA-directed RNA polymerase subunit F